MREYAGELPGVQFFYRDGIPLRVVVFSEETWFSVQDVFNQMGIAVNESGAASLLTAMGIGCCTIPCKDGAVRYSLPCITESCLMRVFDKMERFGARVP
jgi:hypothetical protein